MPRNRRNRKKKEEVDYDSLTPDKALKTALQEVYIDKVKELLDAKTDPNIVLNKDRDCMYTALHVAARTYSE